MCHQPIGNESSQQYTILKQQQKEGRYGIPLEGRMLALGFPLMVIDNLPKGCTHEFIS